MDDVVPDVALVGEGPLADGAGVHHLPRLDVLGLPDVGHVLQVVPPPLGQQRPILDVESGLDLLQEALAVVDPPADDGLRVGVGDVILLEQTLEDNILEGEADTARSRRMVRSSSLSSNRRFGDSAFRTSTALGAKYK